MTLFISTKDPRQVTVSLVEDGKVVEELTDYNDYGSQILLPQINRILDKNNIKFQDLEEVQVETGPGSYTGLKVGVAVANAIGFALKIKVNGKDMETDLKYS